MAGPGALNLAKVNNGGPEAQPALELRSCQVTAFNKAVTPWTLSITVGEVTVSDVPMLGWYDPVVGDIVQVIQLGPTFLALGTVAPGKVYMPPAPPPPPPPPPPAPPAAGAPDAPSTSPTVKAYPITPIGSGTWPSQQPIGSWSNARLWQGGGIAQRAYFFYGDWIALTKGSGTIISGTIFIKRTDSGGVGGGANVRLGGHGYASQPGSAGGHGSVSTVGQLAHNQGKAFVIPPAIIAGLNSGLYKGLGLEPGALGYVTPDYLIAHPFTPSNSWSGQLILNIRK